MDHSSCCGRGNSLTLFGCAKHQRLVDVAQPRDLVLSLLESRLELIGRHLEALDVGGG
jgi:hypothetical protein